MTTHRDAMRSPASRGTALPKTFPGCWESQAFKRRYNAAWMKRKRSDPEVFRAELARRTKLARRGLCFFCGQRREGRMRVVRRLIPMRGGKLVAANVLWCGGC